MKPVWHDNSFKMKSLKDIDLHDKSIVMRVDLNLPRNERGQFEQGARLHRLIPKIKSYFARGASKIALLSHAGRPKGLDKAHSLRPIASFLREHFKGVTFAEDCLKTQEHFSEQNSLVLGENLRFYDEEMKNDKNFAKQLATGFDLYVNEAFSCCHRCHASVEAITHFISSYAGDLLLEEYEALRLARDAPASPSCALIGGAKISTKIGVIENLAKKYDMIVIGGAMAHTFLVARGFFMGQSFYEEESVEMARLLEEHLKKTDTALLLPTDGMMGASLEDDHPRCHTIDDIPPAAMMGDIGPQTVAAILRLLPSCRSVIWNGPLGAFEYAPFRQSTFAVGNLLARLTAEGQLTSLVGGGDTNAALSYDALADKMSYCSLSGGAFLEWIAGTSLIGLEALGLKS